MVNLIISKMETDAHALRDIERMIKKAGLVSFSLFVFCSWQLKRHLLKTQRVAVC